MVWPVGGEIPAYYICCCLTDLTFVGVILDLSHRAFKPEFIHKFLDRLMVQRTVAVMEIHRDATVSITTFVLMEYGCYHCLLFLVLIFFIPILQMIVKRTARHLFELQQ